ncbi:hypothetical protein BDV10DRAFT_17435 [Aspergillus recurvatus]
MFLGTDRQRRASGSITSPAWIEIQNSTLLGDEGQRSTFVHTIDSFPPVLQICLKRYCYNAQLMRMGKGTDFLEYPRELDLEPFLSFRADRSEPCLYRLVGVITHEGGSKDGVYYAYVRPIVDGPFFRFHEEQVTPATMEILDANYGGDCRDMSGVATIAYMLFYCRVSRLHHMFCDVPESSSPAAGVVS